MLTIVLYPGGEDDSFRVGDIKVTATDMSGPYNFQLTVHDKWMTKRIPVTDRRLVEILPGVKVQAGLEPPRGGVKVCVQAKRSIEIWREKLWQEKQAEPS